VDPFSSPFPTSRVLRSATIKIFICGDHSLSISHLLSLFGMWRDENADTPPSQKTHSRRYAWPFLFFLYSASEEKSKRSTLNFFSNEPIERIIYYLIIPSFLPSPSLISSRLVA